MQSPQHRSLIAWYSLRTAAVALLALLGMSVSGGGSALAQERPAADQGKKDSGVLEEVVITGTKRARADSLQEVPLAITAFSESMLKESGSIDLLQVAAMVPNANFRESGTYPGTQRFWMRGTGTNFTVPNFDPAVAVYQDGVFVAQNVAAILETFDMESIEIFRGPQGTLFGRNASAGAVATRSRRPGDKFDLRADVTAGSFGRQDYSVSIGGPATDTLGLKLAAMSRSDDGWLDNTFDGSRRGASKRTHLRATAVWKPSDKVDITVIGERYKRDGDGSWAVSMGLCDLRPCNAQGQPNRDWDQTWDDNFPFVSRTDLLVYKTVLEGNINLGHGILTSVTGWISLKTFNGGQFDGLPAYNTATLNGIKQHQFSEELRYASTFSDTFDFTAGLYYFTQGLKYGEMRGDSTRIGRAQPGVADPMNPYGLRGPGYSELDHDAKGAFLETHWKLGDKYQLTAGVRYTKEDKASSIGIVNGGSCNSYQVPPFYVWAYSCTRGPKSGFDIQDSQDWSDVSPKIALQYQPNQDLMFYGSASRGFRSGGFSMRVAATELTTPGVLRPSYYEGERVDQFEAGMKADWAAGRARTNVTVFYQKWKDIQRTIQQGIQIQRTANVADSHVRGIEFEGNFILGKSWLQDGDQFRLDLALGKIWTGYDSAYVVGANAPRTGLVDVSGQDFAVPHDTRYAALTYEVPVAEDKGKVAFRLSYDYTARWFTEGEIRPTLIGWYRSKNLIDASIDYVTEDGKWDAKVFGKNLSNDQFWEVLVPATDSSGISVPGAPRTYGVSLSYRY